MTDRESCAMCGFVWELVADDEVTERIVAGTAAAAALLRSDDDVSTRPGPTRWSSLEYAAHVRDVLLHVRDRMVIALVEDHPDFKPLYRDERVDLGLYADDTPDVVAAELRSAAGLFDRTFGRLTPEQLDRTCQYLYPTARTRTVRWMAQQVVHEVEHHLADMEQNQAPHVVADPSAPPPA